MIESESGVGIDADACTGDDGGPLVCNDGNNKAVIFGVVSRLGPSCAQWAKGYQSDQKFSKFFFSFSTGTNFPNIA